MPLDSAPQPMDSHKSQNIGLVGRDTSCLALKRPLMCIHCCALSDVSQWQLARHFTTHHLFKRETGPISDSIKNPDTDRLLGFIFRRRTLDPGINVYTHSQSHPPTPPPLCRRHPKYIVIAAEKWTQYKNAQKPTDNSKRPPLTLWIELELKFDS